MKVSVFIYQAVVSFPLNYFHTEVLLTNLSKYNLSNKYLSKCLHSFRSLRMFAVSFCGFFGVLHMLITWWYKIVITPPLVVLRWFEAWLMYSHIWIGWWCLLISRLLPISLWLGHLRITRYCEFLLHSEGNSWWELVELSEKASWHSCFWMYVATKAVYLGLVSFLTSTCSLLLCSALLIVEITTCILFPSKRNVSLLLRENVLV